jgi:hypothetical protein
MLALALVKRPMMMPMYVLYAALHCGLQGQVKLGESIL